MKKNRILFFHAIAFFSLFFVLCAVQTVIWFQFFGSITPPFLSFILLCYFGLDKDSWKSLIYFYSFLFLYSFFSYSSLGTLYFAGLFTYLFLYIVKNRIYWPGSLYFTIMTSASLLIFNVAFILGTWLLEQKLAPILIFERLWQIIITAAVAFLSYRLFKRLDLFFKVETVATELHGEIHG